MKPPIQALYQTGSSLYAVLFNPDDGTVWNQNSQAWEAYNSSHWSQYAVALTEYAGSGYYRVAYPIAAPTVLTSEVIYAQGGGSPTLGDSPVAGPGQSQGANLGAVANNSLVPPNLALTLSSMIVGTVVAGVLTPSSFPTNLSSTTNAAYQGRICLFTSGALVNQVGNIIAYDGTTFTLGIGGPYTAAPSIGDTFIII